MQAIQSHADELTLKLRQAIKEKAIRLPTLPDVALRIKKSVDEESSAQEIAALVAQDVALTGRLVQVANSPLYRGAEKVESIQVAVTRLGTNLVKSLVISLAVRQMFKPESAVLAKCFKDVWEDSVQVAALSRILADNCPGIDPEEALLGGLLHNIGALPILALLDESKKTGFDERSVHLVLDELSPAIGAEILTSWRLPEALASIPKDCRDTRRDSGNAVDYIDIVAAARLQHLMYTGRVDAIGQFSDLAVFDKLGIMTEEVVLDDASTASWARDIQDVLRG